jgi:GTP-binding protein
LQVKNAEYECTAVKPEQFPARHLPEIAFVGRSNIGKSSLINSLVNKKKLAYVGSTPGKTRTINFYNIDQHFYFVDLPGYGYARVSLSEKDSWDRMITNYLETRSELKAIIMLVDSRHTPTGHDQMMIQWIVSHSIPVIVVATKTDKISRSELNRKLLDIRTSLDIHDEVSVIAFSTITKQGIDQLWNQIAHLIL